MIRSIIYPMVCLIALIWYSTTFFSVFYKIKGRNCMVGINSLILGIANLITGSIGIFLIKFVFYNNFKNTYDWFYYITLSIFCLYILLGAIYAIKYLVTININK